HVVRQDVREPRVRGIRQSREAKLGQSELQFHPQTLAVCQSQRHGGHATLSLAPKPRSARCTNDAGACRPTNRCCCSTVICASITRITGRAMTGSSCCATRGESESRKQVLQYPSQPIAPSLYLSATYIGPNVRMARSVADSAYRLRNVGHSSTPAR